MKYNCYVFKIKERKAKEKFRYDIVGYEVFPKVTKELALYLAVKYGGGLMGLDENNAPCHPIVTDRVIGFDKWGNDVDLVEIHPAFELNDFGGIETLTIMPKVERHYLPKRDKWFDKKVGGIIDLYKAGAFGDFSIEAFRIWGPCGLIPEGYEHVKEGLVQEGDFKFDYNSHHLYADRWVSVSASWLGCRIGDKIEYKGLLAYRGDHGYHKDGEVTYGYNPFIIRKKIIQK